MHLNWRTKLLLTFPPCKKMNELESKLSPMLKLIQNDEGLFILLDIVKPVAQLNKPCNKEALVSKELAISTWSKTPDSTWHLRRQDSSRSWGSTSKARQNRIYKKIKCGSEGPLSRTRMYSWTQVTASRNMQVATLN